MGSTKPRDRLWSVVLRGLGSSLRETFPTEGTVRQRPVILGTTDGKGSREARSMVSSEVTIRSDESGVASS